MNTEILIFILALFVFMWLISAWAALAQFSRGKLRRLETRNKKIFRKAEEWMDKKGEYEMVFRFLSFFSIAILGTLSFHMLEQIEGIWPFYQISLVAGAITFILVAFGEMISRALTTRFDIHMLYVTMPLIKIMRYTILSPLVFLIEIVHSRIEKPRSESEKGEMVSAEDEILSLVEDNGDETENRHGALEEDEIRMIKGIFDIDKMFVREIMTPRVDLVTLSSEESVADAKKSFIESGHSRIPIYKESVDDIRGILFAKDFLDEEKIARMSLEQLAHKPVFIPETKAVDDLLAEFKKTRSHIAVVIDEYGGTAGIITLEDIIEEIVGEIHDEYDSKDEADPDYVKISGNSAILNGRTLISDVNEMMNIDIPDNGDTDTIGGYICAEMGRIPESGEQISLNSSIKVTILKADRRKILKIRINIEKSEDE